MLETVIGWLSALVGTFIDKYKLVEFIGVDHIRVQVYNCSANHEDFVLDMMKQINPKLEIDFIHSVENINSKFPQLLVCFNTSRLGTDAKNTIQDVPDLSSSVLIVFHHKEPHALPSHLSKEILVGTEFSNLYGIYDITCSTGVGVYQHKMNTQSIEKLKRYIYTYQGLSLRIVVCNVFLQLFQLIWG